MIENIDKSWYPVVSMLYQEPLETLRTSILPNISFQPLKEDIFRVFEMPVNKIKIVILGIEPSPIPGESIGLSYAMNPLCKLSNSLKAIGQEIYGKDGDDEYSVEHSAEITPLNPEWKTLNHWTKQGIFLLNTALTVETGNAGSHLKYWEEFTRRVISYISVKNPCIWLLWGAKAQKFIPYINSCPFHVKGYTKTTIQDIPANEEWNYILTAPHPAAETYTGGKAGFYGCNHFLYANEILKKLKHTPINW